MNRKTYTWITTNEAAEILGKSARQVRRYAEKGRLVVRGDVRSWPMHVSLESVLALAVKLGRPALRAVG